MAFDPKAYLSEDDTVTKKTGFDPAAYLSEEVNKTTFNPKEYLEEEAIPEEPEKELGSISDILKEAAVSAGKAADPLIPLWDLIKNVKESEGVGDFLAKEVGSSFDRLITPPGPLGVATKVGRGIAEGGQVIQAKVGRQLRGTEAEGEETGKDLLAALLDQKEVSGDKVAEDVFGAENPKWYSSLGAELVTDPWSWILLGTSTGRTAVKGLYQDFANVIRGAEKSLASKATGQKLIGSLVDDQAKLASRLTDLNARIAKASGPQAKRLQAFKDALLAQSEKLSSRIASENTHVIDKTLGQGVKNFLTSTQDEVAALATRGATTLTQRIPAPVKKDKIKPGSFLTSLRTRLKGLGDDGVLLADKLDNMERSYGQKLGESEKVLTKVFKRLDDDEMDNLVSVLDKGEMPINSNVGGAADEIKGLFNKVADEAEELLPGFKRRKKFFPRTFSEEFVSNMKANDKFLTDKAAELVKTGEFESIEQAQNYLKTAFRRDVFSKKYGSLDFPRIANLDGWIRDPKEVLPKYFQRAWRRISVAKEFGLEEGPQEIPKFWTKIANKIKVDYGIKESDDVAKLLDDARKAVFQDYRPLSTIAKGSANLRNFMTFSKLGLAQLTNIGQTANTVVRTSFADTVKGLRNVIKDAGASSDFAQDAGAMLHRMSEEIVNTGLKDSAFSQKLASKLLKYTGFESVEKFNRILAANTTKVFVNRQLTKLIKNPANKVARRKLSQLGIDVEEAISKGSVSDQEMLDAAFKVVKDTQFTTQAADLPLAFQDPLFKLMFQFKSFAFQHGKFIKDHVFNELIKHKNPAPLMRMLVAMGTIGEGVVNSKAITNDILSGDFNLTRTKDRMKMGIIERGLEDFSQIGGFGLATDIWFSTDYGKNGLAKVVLGPALSTGVDIAQPAFQTAKGILGLDLGKTKHQSQTLLGEILRQVPVVGKGLKKAVRPDKRKKTISEKRAARKARRLKKRSK